ncbi:hypothetical protein, partial [Raoultella planticola]
RHRARIFAGWRLAPYPAYKTPNIRRLCVFRRPAQATRRRAIPEKRMLSAIGDDFRRLRLMTNPF